VTPVSYSRTHKTTIWENKVWNCIIRDPLSYGVWRMMYTGQMLSLKALKKFSALNNNNNNNNNTRTTFMVLSSCWSSIARVHPGSRSECSTSPGPSRSAWTIRPPVGCQLSTLTIANLLLLSPKADTHFTIPRKVEGWVDLVGWLHIEMVYPLTHVLSPIQVLTGPGVE